MGGVGNRSIFESPPGPYGAVRVQPWALALIAGGARRLWPWVSSRPADRGLWAVDQSADQTFSVFSEAMSSLRTIFSQ